MPGGRHATWFRLRRGTVRGAPPASGYRLRVYAGRPASASAGRLIAWPPAPTPPCSTRSSTSSAPGSHPRLSLRLPGGDVRLLRDGGQRARALGVPDAPGSLRADIVDVRPLYHFPVLRDLVVDMAPFHDRLRAVGGALVPRPGPALCPHRRRFPRAAGDRRGHRVHRLRDVRVGLHHGGPRAALSRAGGPEPRLHPAARSGGTVLPRRAGRCCFRTTHCRAATDRAIARPSARWVWRHRADRLSPPPRRPAASRATLRLVCLTRRDPDARVVPGMSTPPSAGRRSCVRAPLARAGPPMYDRVRCAVSGPRPTSRSRGSGAGSALTAARSDAAGT